MANTKKKTTRTRTDRETAVKALIDYINDVIPEDKRVVAKAELKTMCIEKRETTNKDGKTMVVFKYTPEQMKNKLNSKFMPKPTTEDKLLALFD